MAAQERQYEHRYFAHSNLDLQQHITLRSQIDKDQEAAAIEHKNQIAKLQHVIQQHESVGIIICVSTCSNLTSRTIKHSGLRWTRTCKLLSMNTTRLLSCNGRYSSSKVYVFILSV
jgi:hypothetical protein